LGRCELRWPRATSSNSRGAASGFSATTSVGGVLVERSGKEGWAVASEEGVTVALDTTLDAELELEGRVYDLIHTLNGMRKEQGLELTDRITVTLPQADADLIDLHAEWIKREVLAVSLETDGVAEPQIAKVTHQRRRIDR
jgi:isoleucyl-tRNA synthetase